MSRGALRGALAPDGSHIAYIDTPFESSILRVMRRDGSADREIAHGVGHKLPFCRQRFAWSPTSTQLVYVAGSTAARPFDDSLWLYDVASESVRQVTQGGWMLLLGWQDADHVLALVAHSYEQPRRFALLAIADGQRQVIGTLSTRSRSPSAPAPPFRKRSRSLASLCAVSRASTCAPTIVIAIALRPPSDSVKNRSYQVRCQLRH